MTAFQRRIFLALDAKGALLLCGRLAVRIRSHTSTAAATAAAHVLLQQAGGAIFAHSGTVHLDRSLVRDNTAAEGAGVALSGGSRLTASHSELGGNRLLAGGGSEAAAAAAGSNSLGAPGQGADLLLTDGGNSAAYLDPLPEAGQLSGELDCCPAQRRASQQTITALFAAPAAAA